MNPARTASPILKAIFDRAAAAGVANAELARRTDTPKNNVLNWRAGKNAPSVFAVEELAHALGCKIVLVPVDEVSLEEALAARGVRINVTSVTEEKR